MINSVLVVPLIAILASPNVTEGQKKRVISGGEQAEYALSKCLDDPRPIERGFLLKLYDEHGRYELNCQVLNTTTGLFYGVKGRYVKNSEMLDTLIKFD